MTDSNTGDGPEVASTAPTRSFGSDLVGTFGTNVGIAALNVATGVAVAKVLRPTGRGDLAAIFLWPTLLSVIAMLGTGEAIVYLAARERNRAGRFLGTAIAITLAASAVLMAVGWLAMPVLLHAQDDNVVTPARWYLLQIPVAAVFSLMLRTLQGIGDVRRWNIVRLFPTLAWVGVLIWALVRDRTVPRALMFAFLFGRIALLPITWLITRRRLRQRVVVDRETAPRLMRFGLPSVATVLPSQLNVRLDQLLLAALLPGRELGLYVVAVSWSQFSTPALLALGSLLFPRIAASSEPERQRAVAAQGMRLAFMTSCGLAIVALVLTPTAIEDLFGSEYRGAITSAFVLVIAAAVAGYAGVQEEILRGCGKPSGVLWSQLIGLGATLAALGALLGPLGIVGAAIASVIGYTVTAVTLTVQSRRALDLRFSQMFVAHRGDLDALRAQIRLLREQRKPQPTP